MLDQTKRFGKFTSSQIAKLMTLNAKKDGFGAPALKYIKQRKMELRFGRSLEKTASSREMDWGKLCEKRVFQLLSTEYVDMFDETFNHPIYKSWCGTPDCKKIIRDILTATGEVKCPYSHESFFNLVDSFQRGGIDEVRKVHDKGEDYYWQCISNAELLNTNKAELIVYMPYQKELEKIRLEASSLGFTWVDYATDSDLPYLLNDGEFKNINTMPFDIPENDLILLRNTVGLAENLLNS